MTIWIEITGRRDLGANLNAPQGDKNGNPHWSYRLIHDVRPGERVFHWDTGHQAVVGVSTAVGRPWADNVLWAARGTRSRGIEPHVQPGWYLALEGFTPLATPLTAAEVFERRDEVFAVRDRLRAAQRAALAFPFILYGGTKVQAFQTYLTRFPAELAELFPSLMEALGDVAPATQWPAGGSAYRPANELTAVGDRDPFEVDPAQVERALRGHARTQNALAAAVTRSGGAPLSPDWSAPSYDLAWHHQGRTYVAEVKSLTPTNEERQLRLGLGQVLRYRQIMRRLLEREVTAVLAVESQPSDTAWAELCAALDVVLCWGPTFDLDLIAPRATSSEDTLPA